jgi:hypothetical protein
LRKAQEGHLEEEKPQKPTKGTKSGKAKQDGKELRKALIQDNPQNQHKSSKSILPLKSTPLALSMLALPLR